MWANPHGIKLRDFLPWRAVVKFIAASICLSGITVGMVFIFARADYEDDQRDKTTILCPDKVAKMKLTPSEARIAYDLCKETEGKLP